MAKSRLIGDYPVIGIRPTIDGRRGVQGVRESLEEQTMNMAKSAAKLFTENLKYSTDEASKKATIEANGLDNLTAAISNIILGKASIDTFDDAIKSAKKAGYDELLKINQAAYDRYISVIK